MFLLKNGIHYFHHLYSMQAQLLDPTPWKWSIITFVLSDKPMIWWCCLCSNQQEGRNIMIFHWHFHFTPWLTSTIPPILLVYTFNHNLLLTVVISTYYIQRQRSICPQGYPKMLWLQGDWWAHAFGANFQGKGPMGDSFTLCFLIGPGRHCLIKQSD